MKWLNKVYRILLCLMPVILFFSYYPVITLGKNESMNLELSIPLIWLVIFDVIGLILMGVKGKLKEFVRKWYFILFPIFASLSIIWSDNVLRGVLTAGVMWAIFVAIFVMVSLRDELDEKFKKVALRVFLWGSVAICAWCFLQCILDLMGVSRDGSLLCAGCVSRAFGFPHPNGFAIEPQFMGNLLLAPTLVAAVFCFLSRRRFFVLLLVFASTLFLTMSRGAIYAFIVALVFITAYFLMQKNKQEKIKKQVFVVWGMVILSFVFTLNVQGVMAEVGPTTDTYQSAVAKVLNQLSLGVIDVREKNTESNNSASISTGSKKQEETPVSKNEPIFDGYVEESTEVRKIMTRNALKVWSDNPRNILIGVGLGGAGEAMWRAGLTDSPKEIVQNQYVSLLLEVGVVGVGLILVLVVAASRSLVILIKRNKKEEMINPLIFALLAAYGVSLVFFAGLPNALQVYLMPAWVWVTLKNN